MSGKLVLEKYDSDSDVYLSYEFDGECIKFERGYKKAQTQVPLTKWTYRLDEIGWKSKDRYINHLKTLGFEEVKHERMENLEAAVV